MNLKMSAIAAIVTAAALTGISSTIPMVVYADESETDTDQENKQKNIGSGNSFNNNCAENTIDSDTSDSDCTDNNQPSDGGVIDSIVPIRPGVENLNLADLFDLG